MVAIDRIFGAVMEVLRGIALAPVAAAGVVGAGFALFRAGIWLRDGAESDEHSKKRLEELKRKRAEEEAYFANLTPEQIEMDSNNSPFASRSVRSIRNHLRNSYVPKCVLLPPALLLIFFRRLWKSIL